MKKILLLILAGMLLSTPVFAQPGRPGGPGGFGRPAGGMGMHGARPPMMRPGGGMHSRPPMHRPPVGNVHRPPVSAGGRPPMNVGYRPPMGPPPGIAHRPPMHPLPPRPLYHRPLRPIVYTSPLYYPIGYYSSYAYYPSTTTTYITGDGTGSVIVQETSPYAGINTAANVVNAAANVATAIRLLTW